MQKLTKYQIKKISNNLEYFYNIATLEQIKEGEIWYSEANKFCLKLSKKYNKDAYIVASVLSALSPRNKWTKNKIDCNTVLAATEAGLNPEKVKVSTFHKNKYKAFNIANNKQIIVNNSLKTFNFLNNIAYLCPESITIDVWHLRACTHNMKFKNIIPTNIAYNQIKDITINLANKYNIKGYQLQAIIWLSFQSFYKQLNK